MKINLASIVLGIILGIIIMSLFTRGCDSGSSIVTDTVLIESVKYDTIFPDTVYRPIPAADNPGHLTTARDSFIFDTLKVLENLKIREYTRFFEDSLARIRADVKVYGNLLDLRVSHMDLRPVINTTKVIDRTITNKEMKGGLYLGAATGIGVERINIDLDYTAKNGWMYGYRYEPTTNSHMIKVGKKIF